MALFERLAFIRNSVPQNFTRLLVERVDHPAVARPILRRIAVAVKTGTKRRVRIAANRAGHKDAVAPDDRTRMSEARNRRVPENVLPGLTVPFVRQVLPLGDARCPGTTKSRPASFRRSR